MTERPLNLNTALTTIRRFITGKLLESGYSGYVVGLSGGLDSSVAAALAVAAVGQDKVLGLLMPYHTSLDTGTADAKALAGMLGIDLRLVDISPMIDAYFPDITSIDCVRAGNKMARERMAVLFDTAHATGRLVLGTSNRTEVCLGYTTWFGDSAASIQPIADLYKTEVRQAAETLAIPESIVNRIPTAGLWPGQTDEAEIGVSYPVVDKLLMRMIDDGITSMAALEVEGFDTVDISRVMSLVNRNSFKRMMPAVAPLGRVPIPNRLQIQP